MDPVHTLSTAEHDELHAILGGVSKNPYADYRTFGNAIQDLIDQRSIPEFFLDVMGKIVDDRSTGRSYAHVLRNCPTDVDIPDFDSEDAVFDKYKKKSTFVGEALLTLVSKLTDTPLIGYTTRNNADFFHDVYPMRRYHGTQTQKSDSELFWHNDRTAHRVRPDYLALLGMRCPDAPIYTGYIDGRVLLGEIGEREREILRQPHYFTRFDKLSRDSNPDQIRSEAHPILSGDYQFRYFDTRTRCLPDAPQEAYEALLALRNGITEADKQYHRIQDGELLLIANQSALHCRAKLEDPNGVADLRWLLKTYAFGSTAVAQSYAAHWTDDVPGLIRD